MRLDARNIAHAIGEGWGDSIRVSVIILFWIALDRIQLRFALFSNVSLADSDAQRISGPSRDL